MRVIPGNRTWGQFMRKQVSSAPKRSVFVALALAVALASVVAASVATTRAAASPPQLTYQGTSTLGSAAGTTQITGVSPYETRPSVQNSEHDIRSVPSKKRASAAHGAPAPELGLAGGGSGFEGISHLDQRSAGTGIFTNTQFSLEPPDQGLCVSGNRVLETVNTALRVYKPGGKPLTAPVALNQFLGLAPEVDRTGPVYGDFTSDPKCYHDSANGGHWFLTLLQLGVVPSSGAFDGTSKVYIAVSQTDDPVGVWNIFRFVTTNDGADCTGGCLGDQPLIGADANGFYISTNSFPLGAAGFNGVELYAISKNFLETVSGPSGFTHLEIPTLEEGQAYSIQPATAPNGRYETAANGTEYFLSALDFNGTGDNRIAAWALTNTASLNTVTPNLTLSEQTLSSESYSAPPVARQKDGVRPLGDLIPEPVNFLNSNDDRMNQVVFAGGRLWSGVNTAVTTGEGTHAGIAYFAVKPTIQGGGINAKIKRQGYIAANKVDVMFPSIGVNDGGGAVAVFTASGPKMFPSVAYANLSAGGSVVVAGAGAGPADGFTGYTAFGGSGVERWGDYSAAVAAPDGSIWAAGEFTSANRTFLANWGTFIIHVIP